MTAPITLKTPSDVAAAVPQVLGFHPEDSLVMLTFGPNQFHARVDLPTDEEGRRGVLDSLRQALVNNQVEGALLATYTGDVTHSEEMIDALTGFLNVLNVKVMDALRIHDGHVFAHSTGEQVGTVDPNPTSLGSHAPAPKTTRAELAASVAPPATVDATVNEALTAAGKAAEVTTQREHGEYVRHINGRIEAGLEVTLRERALLLVVMTNNHVRDVATVPMRPETGQVYVDFWTSIVRRFPAQVEAYQCLAFAAWQAGDGALSWCAVDQIFELNEDDTMGTLVATVLTNGVNPLTWEQMSYDELPIFKDN